MSNEQHATAGHPTGSARKFVSTGTAIVGGLALLVAVAGSAVGVAMTAASGSIELLRSAVLSVTGEDLFNEDDGLVFDDTDDHDDDSGTAGRDDEGGSHTGAVSDADLFSSGTRTVSIGDVTELDLEVLDGGLMVQFDDSVSEAELTLSEGDAPWLFRVVGTELDVQQRGSSGGASEAILVLPASLAAGENSDAGLDEAEVSLGSGTLDLAGDFKRLDLTVGSGDLSFTGSASDFALEVEQGTATVDVSDATRVSLDAESGSITSVFTGGAPSSVEVSAEQGDVDVELPSETYRLVREAESGTIDSSLRTSERAKRVVEADVESGTITLR